MGVTIKRRESPVEWASISIGSSYLTFAALKSGNITVKDEVNSTNFKKQAIRDFANALLEMCEQ